MEKGPLRGSGGLDVRIYSKGVSNADLEKGVNAELRMNIEIPDPIIQSVTPPEIALFGRSTITVRGESIASMLFESKVYVGTELCLDVVKLNPTTLTCTAPAALEGNDAIGPVAVTVAILTKNGTNVEVLKYGLSHVTTIFPQRLESVGGQKVTIRGELLGGHGKGPGFPEKPLIILAGTACTKAERTQNKNEFTCISGASKPGEALAATVIVAKGEKINEITDSIVDVIPPQIVSLSPTEGPTFGENDVVIDGSGFGNEGEVVSAFVGNTPCLKTTLVSKTRVVCVAPKRNQGAGIELVRVEVSNIPSTPISNTTDSIQYGYVDFGLLRLDPPKGPAYGNVTVNIFGRYLGIKSGKHMSPEIRIGGVPCITSELKKEGTTEFVTCVTPPSVPGSKDVTITVNDVTSSPTLSYEYRSPEIFTLSPTGGPTYGGVTVDVRGEGLGTEYDAPLVKFGKGSVCEHPDIIVPHTHLRCLLPSTVTPGATVVTVSVNGVASEAATSDARSNFQYAPPTIASMTPTSGATYGDWMLEIIGENFGRGSGSSNTRVLVGGLECRDVDVVGERTVRCLSPPSVPGKTKVVVEVGGVPSTTLSFVTMTGPAVDLVSPSNGPSYGGTTLIVSGTHLADLNNVNVDVEVTVGGRKCTNVAAKSESHVECVAPASDGNEENIDLPLDVTVKVLGISTKVGTYTYQRPQINNIEPSQGPTRGGTQLTLIGNHLEGTDKLPPIVTLGGVEGTTAAECKVISSTKRTLHCVTGDHVTSGPVPVFVTIDGVRSEQVEGKNSTFEFLAPEIDAVVPEVLPSYGSTLIDITGRFYGDDKDKLFVVIGGVPCVDLEVVSDEHLRCTAPPHRPPTIADLDESQTVIVTYNKASSDANGTSVRYKAPELRRVVPDRGYRDIAHTITLEGRFLGKGDDVETTVLLGADSLCGNVKRVTEHIVTCEVPPGFSGKFDVTVRVGEDSSTLNGAFTRDDAKIILDTIIPRYVPFWSDTKVSINVHTYGLSTSNNLNVQIGDIECGNVTTNVISNDILENHALRTLECILPANIHGPPGKVPLIIALRDGKGDDVEMNSTEVTVGHPRFSTKPRIVPSYGRTVVTFKYSEMSDVIGTDAILSRIHKIAVGPLLCTGIKMDRITGTIQCALPRGPAGNVFVQMSLMGNNGRKTLIGDIPIVYAAPIVDEVVPPLGTTLGGDLLVLKGRYFGENQDQVEVRIGGQKCRSLHRYNSTEIQCVTGDHLSSEGDYPIVVTVTTADDSAAIGSNEMTDNIVESDQGNNATEFSYRGPTASGINPPYGTPFGGDAVNISGAGFGAQDESALLLAFVGGKPCRLTTWLSENTVECVTPAGFGEAVDVTVSVAGKTFDVPEKFKYMKPRVASISPNRGAAWRPNRVTIRGPSVIPSDFEDPKKLTVRIGPSDCIDVEIVRDYKNPNNNVVTCTTTPVTIGSMTYPVVVSDGIKFSEPEGAANFTFEDPMITEKPLQQPFYGGIHQTFIGRNFGDANGLKPENFTLLVGNNECPELEWISDTEIQCRPNENQGEAVPITIVVNDWDSEATALSTLAFNEPIINHVSPNGIPTYGTDTITIIGANLGTPKMYKEKRVVIDVDGQICENLVLKASPALTGGSIVAMEVSCDAPPAKGSIVPHFSSLSILIDDVHGSSNVKSLRYLSPFVTSILPSSLPATGYEDIMIRGNYFGDGTSAHNISASINGTLCEETQWISMRSLRCKVPPGHTEANANVIVSVNGHTDPRNLNNALLRYTGPKVLSVMPMKGPAYGGTRITLTGRGLASTDTPIVGIPFVRIANSSCVDVTVISDQKIQCTTTDSFDVGYQPIRLKLWMGMGYSATDDEDAMVGSSGSVENMTKNETARRFFYDGPIIRDMSPLNGAAYGGDVLHLTGTNFGNGSTFTEVHVGKHGVCTNLTVVDDEHITCLTPSGATRDNTIALQVGENVARQVKNFTFHYRLPYVQCVDPATTTTGGGERLTLLGRDFGNPSLKPMAYIGGVECKDLQYVDENVLTCVAPPMEEGKGHDVVVTVLNGDTGTHHAPHFIFSGIDNGLMSYDRPLLETVEGDMNGPSYGHSEITVFGEHVGNGQDLIPPSVFIGNMSCLETMVLTNFSLLCTTPKFNTTFESDGYDQLPITIRLGPSTSNIVSTLNYTFTRPIVNEIQGQAYGAQYGGTKLTLIGKGLGITKIARPKIFVGEFPCKQVKVIDDTKVECVTTEGTGKDLKIRLINGLEGKITSVYTFTYQPSTIKQTVPSHVRWYGNEWVIIDGSHLGSTRYAPLVTIGGVACLETRFMGNSLQCLTPPGHEDNAQIIVRVGNVTTLGVIGNNDTLTYTPPVIQSIAAGISLDDGSNSENVTSIAAVPQYGGGWISIRGLNLAPSGCVDVAGCRALSPTIMIGSTVCNRTMSEREASGAPTLLCRTTAKPKPGNFSIRILANGMESVPMNLLFSAPIVDSVIPTEGAFNERHALTIRGRFFGDASGNMSTEVTVGGQPCNNVVRRSSELLTCSSPLGIEYMTGNSSNHNAPIRVTVDGISSTGKVVFTRTSKKNGNKTTFEYLPPVVTSFTSEDDRLYGPAFGYRNITIHGDNYGLIDSGNVIAMIGGHPCVRTQWISKIMLTCLTPILTLDDRMEHTLIEMKHSTDIPSIVEVVVDGVHSTDEAAAVMYHYRLPRVFKVTPAFGPAYGGTLVTVLGKRLGDPSLPGDVVTNIRLGPYQCENVTVIDEFEVKCITAPGRNIFPVDLDVNGVPSIYNTSTDTDPNSTETTFNYLPMEVHTLSHKEVASYGGERVIIEGKYLGDFALQNPIAFVGSAPCRETIWKSPTKIICVTPHSEAGEHVITVSIGATVSLTLDSTPTLKVIDPTVNTINVKKGGAAGGENITLEGIFLGSKDVNEVVVLVGGVPCAETYRLSLNSLVCTAPARFVGDANALVTVSVDGHTENATSISATRKTATTYVYRILRVISIDTISGPTDGGYEITIHGESFGKTSVAYIGEKRCQSTVPHKDHHSLKCVVPEGVGINHVVEVRVRKNISSLVASKEIISFNYDAPKVMQSIPKRGIKSGGDLINVTGTNFGPPDHPTIVRIGDAVALDVVHVSHTLITCVTPPGNGADMITVEVGNQTSEKMSEFIYIPAEIQKYEPMDGPTSGGWLLTIIGRGFGPNAAELLAANQTAEKELAEDAKEENELEAKEDQEERNAINATNKQMTSEETAEKDAMQTFATSIQAKEQEEKLGDEKRATNIANEELKEENDEQKRMKEAEQLEADAVAQRQKRANATEKIEQDALVRSTKKLEAEEAESLQAEEKEENKENELENKAKISEQEEISTSKAAIQQAKAITTAPVAVDDSLLAAIPIPDDLETLGEESAARFREMKGAVHSNSMRFSESPTIEFNQQKASNYLPPSVSISRSATPSNNGGKFIVESTSLLEIDERIGDGEREHTRQLKRAKAAHRLSEWAQRNRDSSNPYEKYYMQNDNEASRFRFRAQRTAGVAKKFASGVWINGVECGNVTWVSDSKVTCIVPPGVGGHLKVDVISPVDGGLSAEIFHNDTTFMGYTLPMVQKVDYDYGPHGTVVIANGTNFGNTSNVVAYVGQRECSKTVRLSSETVRCIVPKGAGKNLPVTVQVGGQRGVEGAKYTYPPPQVLRTFPEGGTGKGGNLVTIMGRNFGDAESLGSVTVAKIGSRSCKSTTIISDTLIECVAPSGVGKDLHVSVWANLQESVTPVHHKASNGTGRHSNGTIGIRMVSTSARNLTLNGTNSNNSTNSTNSNSSNSSNSGNATVMPTYVVLASNEALYSYPTPTIALMVPDSVSGKGGDIVEIQGESFGESGQTLKVHIGGQPCTQVKVTSSSSITCITPPGKGDAIPVVVITGGQSSEVYDWFEYDGPRIYASNPVQVQHKDDETTRLTFTGIHLGLDEDNGKVQALTVGGYPCINHKRDSAQQWSCDIEEKGRMGKMTPVQLHLPNRHRTSPPNETFAYFSFKAGPELTSNKPSFGPKEGGTVMVIQGVFGPSKPLSVAIQVGETACSTSIWMSPTEISCVIPEGKGHHLIAVEINGAKAELSKDAMGTPITWDYDPPIVDTVSPNSGTTQGNTLLSITGTFDGVASVTISGKACLIESTTSTEITCKSPPGIGAKAPLRVISNDGAQSPAFPFQYDRPIVLETGPKDLPGTMDDGRRLWIRVENIGTNGKENELVEHVAIVLEDSPLKQTKEVNNKGEKGSVGGDGRNSTTAAVTAHGANVANVANGTTNATSAAITVENVESDGLDVIATLPELTGGELCSDVRWGKEPGMVTCLPSAGFGYRSLVAVVAGQTSETSNMSYAPATVVEITPKSEDPGETIRMTIIGTRFTSAPTEVMSVYIGKQQCMDLSIESDTMLQCNITVRPGGNKAVNVQIADLKSPPGITFTATPPVVDTVEPKTCKLVGGCALKITGNNYFEGIETTVSLGKLACENVHVVSKTEISCIVPRGTSGAKTIIVDVGGARNDAPEDLKAQMTSPFFSYPLSSVSKVRPTHGSKNGGTTLIIEGAGFGETLPTKGDIEIAIGGTPCTSTKWISDTKVECVTPPEPASIGSDFNCVSVTMTSKDKEGVLHTSKTNSKFRYEHKGADSSVASVQITPSNVDSIINGDRPAIIKICTPSCEKCVEMKHAWNEMARLMQCKNIIVGTIRGDLYPQLMERYAIDEYPRIVWFSEGRTTPTKEYTGLFSAERMIGWIARQFGHPNAMWSPLDDSGEGGDPGEAWKTGAGAGSKSPLVIGQGLPKGSSNVCKAAIIKGVDDTATEEKVASKKRFFFF